MENEEIVTTIPPFTITTTEMEEMETTTEMPEDSTTLHPHATPLPWAYAELTPFTGLHIEKNHTIISTTMEGQNVKRWSQNSGMAGDPFNVILAKPHLASEAGEKLPLVVLLHDGPHEQSTQDFCLTANTFLEMGMAVLLVNYRGSIGMGDASLESIISNILLVINFFEAQAKKIKFDSFSVRRQ